MAKFTMQATAKDTDFDYPRRGEPLELARMLRETADNLERGFVHGYLTDLGGNTVGEWHLKLGD